MKYDPLIFGIGCVCISVVVMIYGHEYAISGGVFILGMALIGYAYTKLHESEEPKINTEAVNENIRTLNNLLWGTKEKNESTVKITPEQYWQVSVQDRCRDIEDTSCACYCHYGGKRGYCTFERCPRRIKQ